MFGGTLTLFRMRGVEVRIDLSWLLIFALIVWSLAAGLLPATWPGLSRTRYVALGSAGAALILLSILLHELAHAIAAQRAGVQLRSITLFLFGGVSELHDEAPRPSSELKIALAGPATSLVAAGVFFASSLAVRALGGAEPVWMFLGTVGGINLLLVAFNLIPAFPLDGGRILRAILWKRSGDLRRATRTASAVGALTGFVLIGVGVASLITGQFLVGLWWIIGGFYVRSASLLTYQKIFIREALRGEPVRSFMKSSPVTVPRAISVQEFVDEYVYKFHHKLYPVLEQERLVGCITTAQVRGLPREEWERQTVGSLAEECSAENTIDPDEDALDALARMSRKQRSRLIVARNGELAGVVTLKDLMAFLTVRMELELDEQGTDRSL